MDAFLAGVALSALLLAGVLGSVVVNQARAHTKALEIARRLQEEVGKFAISTFRECQEQALKIATNQHAVDVIRQNGVGPFLMDPNSRVNDEVTAVMHNLECDRETAKQYLRSSFAVRQQPNGEVA